MIKLVSNATKTYESEGSKIYYKEAFQRDVDMIYKSFTKTKKNKIDVDFVEAKDAILKKYITGWDDVNDEGGTSIPFSPDLLSALPGKIRNDLFTLITAGKLDVEEDEEEKN